MAYKPEAQGYSDLENGDWAFKNGKQAIAAARQAGVREGGLRGPLVKDETDNCYAACVSALTGIPFDDLKATPEELRTLSDADLINRMNRILTENGWRRVRLMDNAPVGFAVAGGPSPRGDWEHAVIVLDGEFYHDPHPSNQFVPAIENYEVYIRLVQRAALTHQQGQGEEGGGGV